MTSIPGTLPFTISLATASANALGVRSSLRRVVGGMERWSGSQGRVLWHKVAGRGNVWQCGFSMTPYTIHSQ